MTEEKNNNKFTNNVKNVTETRMLLLQTPK